MKATVDGRPWDRDMPIKWKGAEKGSVCSQRCKGSYKCENPNCSFKQQHGKVNTIQFENNRDDDVMCKGCGRCSVFVSCSARKYMQFLGDLLEVRVYHVGTHTTDALRNTKKISNLKATINKENNPAGHRFEAVAHLKQKSDEKDQYFIYKMNDRHMNPDEPSLCIQDKQAEDQRCTQYGRSRTLLVE